MTFTTQDRSNPRVHRLESMLVRQRNRDHDRSLEHRRRRELLEDTVRSLEARVADMTAETDHLRAELDGVYRSSSWRFTAPLRWLRRLLG